MREPGFWYRPASFKSHLLRPLAALYGAVAGRRLQRRGIDAGIPVLCVGNYHGGGAGKTPAVQALAKLLHELGETPVVLSRGYRGKLRGPVKVDPQRHSAADVGDEPLMLAASLPVVVARDRVAGVVLAKSMAASVILMDDGFQNPAVAKDASLIVIDSARGLGNGQVMPAGPLRAPLRLQIERTDALVVIGDGKGADALAGRIAGEGKPVLRARFVADEASLAALAGKRVLAFAGIGDPVRFFNTLRRKRDRGRARPRVRRSPRVLAARDRGVARGSQTRRADTGDDGKGSGAAAGACRRDRAVQGHAGVRRRGRIAAVPERPTVQGAREKVPEVGWVSEA